MVDRVEFVSDTPAEQAIAPEHGTELDTEITNEASPNVVDSSRPSWLPDKFSSAEDLAQAYVELERKQSAESGGEADSVAGEGEAPAELSTATLNHYSEKYFSETGLSDEDYGELEKLGVSRDLVSQYASGMAALQLQNNDAIFAEAGGSEKSYTDMLLWAETTLGDNEKTAFNAVIQGDNIEATKMAVRGLHARYAQVTGKEAHLVQGDVRSSGEGAYRSTAQLTAAMNDPRYDRDPAYRNQVIQKLKNSSAF